MSFFSKKKCLFLWDFFTDMGLEWSQAEFMHLFLVKNERINSVLGQNFYVFASKWLKHCCVIELYNKEIIVHGS